MRLPSRTWAVVLALLCLAIPLVVRADSLPRHGLLGAVLTDTAAGVTIRTVLPGTAAALAQLQAGDVITKVGNETPKTASDAVRVVRATPAGSTLPITYLRDGATHTVDAILGTPPREADPNVTTEYDTVTVDGSLRRTLVDVPKPGSGRHPAVLLIGGIGCFSVDVAANQQDGYLRVTRDLTRAGFVTMRLEKSGVGDSQGPPCLGVDFDHERASYTAALDALRADPRVDPKRVYLLGHSIGSVVAPRLALERPVAGVIVSEAVGRNWFEYELENLRRQLEVAGDTPVGVDTKLAEKERCMHRLLIAKEAEADIERSEPDCKVHNGIYPVGAAYMQQVAALNIIEPWAQLNVPVLAIYGTADDIVAPADHQRIVDVVNAAHPGRATLRKIDAMNHYLQVAASAAESSANTAAAKPSQYQTEFSRAILGWICNLERCAPAAYAS